MSSPSRSDDDEPGDPPQPSDPLWAPRLRQDIHGIDLKRPIPATWLLVALLFAVHLWTGWVQYRLGYVDPWDAWIFERGVRFRVASGGQYLGWVEQGETWRLWTSVLFHVDLLHLTLNSVAILALGRLLEPWVGGLRLLAWFCTGGLVGSMCSYLAGMMQSDGASGGAFALLGGAVILGWEVKERLPAEDRRLMGPILWGFVAINLVLSVGIPALDLIGHLGGLLAGIGLGLGVGLWRSRVIAAVDAMWIGFFATICVLPWIVG